MALASRLLQRALINKVFGIGFKDIVISRTKEVIGFSADAFPKLLSYNDVCIVGKAFLGTPSEAAVSACMELQRFTSSRSCRYRFRGVPSDWCRHRGPL